MDLDSFGSSHLYLIATSEFWPELYKNTEKSLRHNQYPYFGQHLNKIIISKLRIIQHGGGFGFWATWR